MIANIKNWTEVTKGLYRYVISANVCYELHILHWDFDTDILTAKASVSLVGDWRQSNGNSSFEREIILAGRSVFECLEAAQKDDEINNNIGNRRINMKKLFVSVPMKGRTEENIFKSIDKMHKIAEIVFGEELEVIPSYVEDNPPKDCNDGIWYLSKSIEKLAEADYFIGINWSDCFKGCNIEKQIALYYGIKTYEIDYKIFPDIAEIENKNLHAI